VFDNIETVFKLMIKMACRKHKHSCIPQHTTLASHHDVEAATNISSLCGKSQTKKESFCSKDIVDEEGLLRRVQEFT